MISDILLFGKVLEDVELAISKISQKTYEQTELIVSKGLYKDALYHYVDLSLEPFREQMIELETKLIRNPNLPFSYLVAEIKQFEDLLKFVKQLIKEIEEQELYGCAILGILMKYSFHANAKAMQASKIILSGIHNVFLHQLSNFIIFGKLFDPHLEFFIVRRSESERNSTNPEDIATTTLQTFSMKPSNFFSSLWQFDIAFEMIPSNYNVFFAEKVLFIGQTVSMLIDDQKRSAKTISVWNEDEDQHINAIESIWKNKEYSFFNRIQKSQDYKETEDIINEIKIFITHRLSEIAFNQGDLIRHLKLFKDFFLLGRGDLFLDFIHQLKNITQFVNPAQINREINQAFQKALKNQTLEVDSLHVCLQFNENVDFSSSDIIKLIRLSYDVKWPLHLFFSPYVLEIYSQIFNFLLTIRHTQNELHLIWRIHREWKVAGNSILFQLRNKMLFFIDNLQYYLHVDVLESQFSNLMNCIQNSNLENTQRAHRGFQANVLSLSFLFEVEFTDSTRKTSNNIADNAVYNILSNIISLIHSYCRLHESEGDSLTINAETLELYEDQ